MPQPEKLKFPKKYRHYALVTFTSQFPIDGLRYDRAFPWKEADARAIEASMSHVGPPVRVIICSDDTYATGAGRWTLQLWNGIGGVTFRAISHEEAETFDRERNDTGGHPSVAIIGKIFHGVTAKSLMERIDIGAGCAAPTLGDRQR